MPAPTTTTRWAAGSRLGSEVATDRDISDAGQRRQRQAGSRHPPVTSTSAPLAGVYTSCAVEVAVASNPDRGKHMGISMSIGERRCAGGFAVGVAFLLSAVAAAGASGATLGANAP